MCSSSLPGDEQRSLQAMVRFDSCYLIVCYLIHTFSKSKMIRQKFEILLKLNAKTQNTGCGYKHLPSRENWPDSSVNSTIFFHGRQVIVSRDVALLFKSPSQLYSVESSIYQHVNDKSLTSSNINVQNMRRHPYEVKIYGCDVNIIPAQSNGVLLNFTSSK